MTTTEEMLGKLAEFKFEPTPKYVEFVDDIVKLRSGERLPQVNDDEYQLWLAKWQALESMLLELSTAPKPIIDKITQKILEQDDSTPIQMIKGMILGVLKATNPSVNSN